MSQLLDTFGRLRTDSLERLGALGLTERDLARRGTHPEFGAVTMSQHLATWSPTISATSGRSRATR